ncbi:MAG: exodeoxyribonuclease VII large subunit, partial [Blastocatellia bacterium]|nr:exodeoxyribonuclease VII large subunit [Blastocatellia bacterium]
PVISAVGHEMDFTIADLVADVRAATPSAAAELVAKAESEICERIDAQFASLRQLMENKLLRAERGLDRLAAAPVFARFPARLREMRYGLDRMDSSAAAAVLRRYGSSSDLLRELMRRLSPITMMASVNRNQRRLELLGQRTDAAGAEMIRRTTQQLENAMATLHAISPLNVLERGYSITQTLDGAILRDAEQSAPGDRLKIRLARGKIEAEVKEIEE